MHQPYRASIASSVPHWCCFRSNAGDWLDSFRDVVNQSPTDFYAREHFPKTANVPVLTGVSEEHERQAVAILQSDGKFAPMLSWIFHNTGKRTKDTLAFALQRIQQITNESNNPTELTAAWELWDQLGDVIFQKDGSGVPTTVEQGKALQHMGQLLRRKLQAYGGGKPAALIAEVEEKRTRRTIPLTVDEFKRALQMARRRKEIERIKANTRNALTSQIAKQAWVDQLMVLRDLAKGTNARNVLTEEAIEHEIHQSIRVHPELEEYIRGRYKRFFKRSDYEKDLGHALLPEDRPMNEIYDHPNN